MLKVIGPLQAIAESFLCILIALISLLTFIGISNQSVSLVYFFLIIIFIDKVIILK